MSTPYDMYPAPEEWGRGASDPFVQRASLAELRHLEAQGVDTTEFEADERLARDVNSAGRARQTGTVAVDLALMRKD
jgi:hypothetical protein